MKRSTLIVRYPKGTATVDGLRVLSRTKAAVEHPEHPIIIVRRYGDRAKVAGRILDLFELKFALPPDYQR